jgi:hypothetical protein
MQSECQPLSVIRPAAARFRPADLRAKQNGKQTTKESKGGG